MLTLSLIYCWAIRINQNWFCLMPCEACDPPFSATIVECYFFFPDANNYVLFFGSIWSQNETNFPFQKNDEVELETTAPTQLIHNRARQADCCSVWIDSVGFLWNYSRRILSVDYVYPLMSINESAGWRCETKKKTALMAG